MMHHPVQPYKGLSLCTAMAKTRVEDLDGVDPISVVDYGADDSLVRSDDDRVRFSTTAAVDWAVCTPVPCK